jgi:gamma-glutamylputrescine oxidase
MRTAASSLYDLSDASGSYYEATVDRPPPAPPLVGRVRADVAVVGGGYAGLSAALELALRGYSVVLLEARTVGWGASGRNGGQVIVGYAGEGAIARQLSPEDARRAWDISVEGLNLVRERIERYGIDCDYVPGHLSLATTARKSAELSDWVEHLDSSYGYTMRPIPRDEIGDWIASDAYLSGAFDPRSGHLHPLKYCLGLAAAARSAGVAFHESSPVVDLVENGSRSTVKTPTGEVVSQFVVLAGNAYLGAYGRFADSMMRRILIVGTFVAATAVLSDREARALIKDRVAAADTNFILDYFRLTADNRLLFGGADIFTGTKPANIGEVLRDRIAHVFPQLSEVSIDFGWSGVIDATINNAPDFGRLGSRVYYLQGFSGHGVALANIAGRLVAEAVSAQVERFDVLARLQHLQFPRHTLARRAAISVGTLFHRLRDAL